ncbi:hypothetical protein T4B_1086 [Trichinella pseudospiralis]|uniref:Uncharacterized protein n=1 Tax=Trichinella pseudospiralis TaxID=6337 RepID=A0A0V1IE71_TRIPS|nr:hypothetical protein T4B_1086 [Trichinella pseudospiralis]
MKDHIHIDPRFNESMTPRNIATLATRFSLASLEIAMFILIVCTCGIGPQAVFTYPDRSGSIVWAAYCAFCSTWPYLRGFNCSINGSNSPTLSVDRLKSGRRRVTVWTGRQWSQNDGPPSCSATKGLSPQGWQEQAPVLAAFFILFFLPS